MKTYKIILRTITYPLILGIILIGAIRMILGETKKWFLYGGELIVRNKDTKNTIAQLFTLVEENKYKKEKCRNCDEMVNMVSEGSFCPNCYC